MTRRVNACPSVLVFCNLFYMYTMWNVWLWLGAVQSHIFLFCTVTTLKIMGKTKYQQYSSLQTVCTWHLWQTTGQLSENAILYNLNVLHTGQMLSDRCVAFAELLGFGSWGRKGWWWRQKETETLMDCAASTIHKGELLLRGKDAFISA